MNAAKKIIEKFGGQSALAALIGKRQSTVQHWAKVGLIPAKWQPELLRLAQENEIDLYFGDFIWQPPAEPVKAKKSPLSEARWWGTLVIGIMGNWAIPCYVLEDSRRILSRVEAAVPPAVPDAVPQVKDHLALEVLAHLPQFFSGHGAQLVPQFRLIEMIQPVCAEIFAEQYAQAARHPVAHVDSVGHIRDRDVVLFHVRPQEVPHPARDASM